MASDQEKLRKLGDQNAIKTELERQFTKHIEEEVDAHDESVVKVKLVVLGPMGAGKTCWLSKMIHDKFNQAQQPTVGAKYSSQGVAIEDYVYNFEIWDVSGEAWCKTLVPMYLQYAQGAVICYDSSKSGSFEEAKEWVEYCKKQGERDLLIAFVGMKSDLNPPNSPAVEKDEAEEFFITNQKLDERFFFPSVSAKTGENVQDVILSIAEAFHETGVKQPRASVMDPEVAYGGMVERARQNEEVGDKTNMEIFQQKMSACFQSMKVNFGICFSQSKEVGFATYESAKVNGKKLGKTINRKSRKFGQEVKSRAAKLIKKGNDDSIVAMKPSVESDGQPQLQQLKG